MTDKTREGQVKKKISFWTESKSSREQVVSPNAEYRGSCHQQNGGIWITACRSSEVNCESEGNPELEGGEK